MNTLALSRRIVAAIDPDGTRWPRLKFREVEDFVKVCECGAHDSTEVIDLGWGEKRECCEACGISHYGDDGWDYVTTGTHLEGPDLAAPENLHLLLEVARSLGSAYEIECCPREEFVPQERTSFKFKHPLWGDRHYGETESLAILAAVCAALGIEQETTNEAP